jgi:hypothetical protein
MPAGNKGRATTVDVQCLAMRQQIEGCGRLAGWRVGNGPLPNSKPTSLKRMRNTATLLQPRACHVDNIRRHDHSSMHSVPSAACLVDAQHERRQLHARPAARKQVGKVDRPD